MSVRDAERKNIFSTLAVIGLGLIGSSILRRAAFFPGLAENLIAIDRAHDVCARVKELGLADIVSQDPQDVKHADCVILCVPVGAMGRAAQAIVPYMKKGAILSDTGSTKCSVIDAICQCLSQRHDIGYVPAHPMAGTEFSGPDAGQADLFETAWCLMTPIKRSRREDLDKMRQFWEKCGAKVKEMSPQHHDDICSKVSHLPHFISFAICKMVCSFPKERQQEIVDYSASGFQDFTRIAGSDSIMWRDIFLSNRKSLLKTLDEFQKNFALLRQALESEDDKAIIETIKEGNYLRHWLVKEKNNQ